MNPWKARCHYNVMSFFSTIEIYLPFPHRTMICSWFTPQSDLETNFRSLGSECWKLFRWYELCVCSMMFEMWFEGKLTKKRVCYKSIEPKILSHKVFWLAIFHLRNSLLSRRTERCLKNVCVRVKAHKENAYTFFHRVNRLGDLMLHELNIFVLFQILTMFSFYRSHQTSLSLFPFFALFVLKENGKASLRTEIIFPKSSWKEFHFKSIHE